MKIVSIISIVTIIFWLIMTIAEIWGDFVSFDIYWRLTITIAILNIALLIVSLIAKEYLSETKMKNEKYIN